MNDIIHASYMDKIYAIATAGATSYSWIDI